jgi:hypothetical protein
MGSTRWSDDHYKERDTVRKATATPTFAYHADVASGKVAKEAHPSLNPHGVKVRECRDSDTHPESRAVAVLMDVTGSMHTVPKMIQAALPKLMGLLIRKNYLEHPAILVGAIGDATCDTVPLQVGQFESGIEIENDLTNLYLEGGGGGHITESYELGMYFIARHTAMDCWEKRQFKGFLFLIGDEIPYPQINPKEVQKLIGDVVQDGISTKELVEELREKWDVYYIMPKMTAHWNEKAILDPWKALLGQNVLLLEDPNAICELIASTIGVAEGNRDIAGIEDDLISAGTSASTARAVGKALVPVAEGARHKGAAMTVPSSGKGSGLATL